MRIYTPPLLLTVLLVASLASAVQAQAGRGAPREGAAAMPGLVHTGLPRAEPGFGLAASAGYGMIESMGAVDGAHHRLAATLAGALTPLPWLTLGLRLDSRFDKHPDDGMGAHSGAVGDPRLIARVGGDLSHEVQLGGELTLWVPGEDAPSVSLGATTIDAKGLFAYLPYQADWSLLSMLGFRLDNSESAAPDITRLRSGDRIALGLSEYHALLMALGMAYSLSDDTQLFGELSADLLLGAKELMQSPMRVSLGARQRLTDSLDAELAATVGLSSRPDLGPADPIVPIEPRVMVSAGVRFGQRFTEPEEDVVLPDEPEPKGEQVALPEPEPEPEPATTVVEGELLDHEEQPLTEARVVLRTPDGSERETISDAEGRYRFEDVPIGPVELSVEAAGFEKLEFQVDAQPDGAPVPAHALVERPPAGIVRGLARSFDSEPLPAAIQVADRRGRKVLSLEADAEGAFEFSLPPGRYTISVTATGYRGHTRRVRIADNSVTILNVDLKEKK